MNRLYGLTIEGTDDTNDSTGIELPKLLSILGSLPCKPTLRLCLEFGVSSEVYLPYARALRGQGYPIFLQPIDSEDVHRYSIQGYCERMQESVSTLSPYIDYLEMANEVNGDWVGYDGFEKLFHCINHIKKPSTIKSVVTVYVTEGYEGYTEQYILPIKPSFLFYSVYPFSEKEAGNFLTNGKMIGSTSLVGVGEYGSENGYGEMGSVEAKIQLIKDFERRKPQTPNDVIGGFYWDFYDDCVKNETGILEVFKEVWK